MVKVLELSSQYFPRFLFQASEAYKSVGYKQKRLEYFLNLNAWVHPVTVYGFLENIRTGTGDRTISLPEI